MIFVLNMSFKHMKCVYRGQEPASGGSSDPHGCGTPSGASPQYFLEPVDKCEMTITNLKERTLKTFMIER